MEGSRGPLTRQLKCCHYEDVWGKLVQDELLGALAFPCAINVSLDAERLSREIKHSSSHLPLKKGSNILGAAVDLGLDLMAGETLANLLEVELILVECILLQSVDIDFAERHGYLLN